MKGTEMLDGRRHSVDIPLSKALVALRRVRSLRDPSTNSMSKFSSFVDNLTWETESCNGISLQLVNGYGKSLFDREIPPRICDFGLDGRRAGSHSDPELDCSSSRPDSKLVSSENLASLERKRFDSKNKKKGYVACRNSLFEERLENDLREKKLDLSYFPPSNNHNDSMAANMGDFATRIEKLKSRHQRRIRSPKEVRGDAGSCVESSYPSVSDGQIDESSHSASLFANEDEHIAGYSNCGCGINSCWSRTPKFRESSLPTDVEDHRLLSGECGETNPFEQEMSYTYTKNEISPHKGSPRSLSHKFRPRSFSELVGQNVVVRSLLNAILQGKITSFYLFHGPRGTGKTSASRIFAAALNCLSLEEHRPCGQCRECVLFSCGRSRDIKEVDPVRTNRTDKLRLLLKNAARPPVSSQFKVFIIDECQLLQGEAWATVLNSLDELPRHVVFVMITADLDSLPRSAVSRCQRYHFPKIKDADIVSRLSRICLKEGWEFDKVALEFIAARSNGSLRDAEMILDQLSLLGKKITISLAHELIGIVSDEELLDLLELALSSDTSRTVRRARELMRSRVDPMQLISQLANLIMDILAGRFQTGALENHFRRQTSEADLQKLRNVLKVLSEIEKQLRTSRNQSTWLTVALLQLSSVDSSSLDSNDSRTCLRKHPDNGLHDKSLSRERLKHQASCLVTDTKSQNLGIHRYSERKLETIWQGAIENCGSKRLKNFFLREGKLSSISVHHDLAVVEVEFCHPDHVSRAEKSWKLIASSLQLVLSCNVEIRIKLGPCAHAKKNLKIKKPCFGLLNCSRRMLSTSDDGIDKYESSDFTSARAIIGEEKHVETCSIDHGKEVATIVSKKKGHYRGNGAPEDTSPQDDSRKGSLLGARSSSKLEGINQEIQVLSIQDPQIAASAQRSLNSPDASHKICLRIQPQGKFDLASPQKQPFETYFSASDPYILCSSSNTLGNSSRNEDLNPGKESEFALRAHCWKTPKFRIRKGWQRRPQQQRCQLARWILTCATAK